MPMQYGLDRTMIKPTRIYKHSGAGTDCEGALVLGPGLELTLALQLTTGLIAIRAKSATIVGCVMDLATAVMVAGLDTAK